MRKINPEQWGAATGFGAVLSFALATVFSRPWPLESGPGFVTFLAERRSTLMLQSLALTAAMGFFLWFLSVLRGFIAREEGATARSGTLVFGAGLLWVGLTLIGQAPQLVLTLPSQQHLDPAHARVLADLCFVTLAMANVPLVVMLLALTLISLRTHVFPTWLAGFSALAALVAVSVFLLSVYALGAVAPQGWLTIALTPALALWLLPTTIVMIHKLGFVDHKPLVTYLKPHPSPGPPPRG